MRAFLSHTRRAHFFKKVAFLFALLAWSSPMGGHWLVPQVWTWGAMIIEYAQKSDLGQAISDTFSGEKPCHRCHSMEIEKAKESGAATPLLVFLKSEPYSRPLGMTFSFPECFRITRVVLGSNSFISQGSDEPPVPPPQA